MGLPPESPGSAPGSPPPDLSRWLARIVELAALLPAGGPPALGPEALLERCADLRARLTTESSGSSNEDVATELAAWAEKRFALVDEAHEYALATDEVLTLSLVLADAPQLVGRALQQSVLRLSHALGEPDVPRLFGRLLGRLRELGRQPGGEELSAWVQQVAASLPGD